MCLVLWCHIYATLHISIYLYLGKNRRHETWFYEIETDHNKLTLTKCMYCWSKYCVHEHIYIRVKLTTVIVVTYTYVWYAGLYFVPCRAKHVIKKDMLIIYCVSICFVGYVFVIIQTEYYKVVCLSYIVFTC